MKAGGRFHFAIGRRSFAGAGVRSTRPFAKCAKERGTQCIADGTEIKKGGPPAQVVSVPKSDIDKEEAKQKKAKARRKLYTETT
jgi:hypothetical protein